LVTHRQTDKQTNKNRQKHYLLGGGKNHMQCALAPVLRQHSNLTTVVIGTQM